MSNTSAFQWKFNRSVNRLPGDTVGRSENHFPCSLRATLIYRGHWQAKGYAWVSFSCSLWVFRAMTTLRMSHETWTLQSGVVPTLGTPDGLNKLGFAQEVFAAGLLCDVPRGLKLHCWAILLKFFVAKLNIFTGVVANSRHIRQFETVFEGPPPYCGTGCLQFFLHVGTIWTIAWSQREAMGWMLLHW